MRFLCDEMLKELARWLHRVTVPVHLLWGEADGYVTPEYGERLAAQLPDARLDVVAGAGHYPQYEQVEETVALLAAGPCTTAGG